MFHHSGLDFFQSHDYLSIKALIQKEIKKKPDCSLLWFVAKTEWNIIARVFRETIFTFASAQFRCLIRLRVMMKMHLPVRGKWRGLDNEQETSSQEPWMLFLAVTLYLSDLEQISPSHCLGPNSLLCLIGLLWEVDHLNVYYGVGAMEWSKGGGSRLTNGTGDGTSTLMVPLAC